MRCASWIYINFGSEFFGPSPGAAGVVQVDVGCQEMPDIAGSKSEFADPRNYGAEDGFRAAVHQEQFIWSAFDQCDANDVGLSEVECVDQMNHPEQ